MTRGHLAALIVCACAPALSFASANDEVAFDDVPAAVLDTAIRTAPGVTFDRVSIEIEDGVVIYEFEAKDHKGRHIEIDVTETGDLDEIEMEIHREDVPAVVLATLDREAPGFEETYIELSVRNGGAVFVYEFEGAAAGRPANIEIAESGELLLYSETLS